MNKSRIQPRIQIGFQEVMGVNLRYAKVDGEGPPLLICNGIGANLELGFNFLNAFKGRQAVLFELPGIGGSDKALFFPTMRNYSRYATGLLHALGIHGPFFVAGVSWGGTLAQQIARDNREKVLGLILMATTPGVVMVPGKPSAFLRMMTPQRYLSKEFMKRNAGAIYGGDLRDRSDLIEQLANMTRAPSTLSYFQQLTAGITFSSLLWLWRFKFPALVISGADDPIVRPINGRILAALLRNSRFELMENGGHLFMIMQADQTAEKISSFIDAVLQ